MQLIFPMQLCHLSADGMNGVKTFGNQVLESQSHATWEEPKRSDQVFRPPVTMKNFSLIESARVLVENEDQRKDLFRGKELITHRRPLPRVSTELSLGSDPFNLPFIYGNQSSLGETLLRRGGAKGMSRKKTSRGKRHLPELGKRSARDKDLEGRSHARKRRAFSRDSMYSTAAAADKAQPYREQ